MPEEKSGKDSALPIIEKQTPVGHFVYSYLKDPRYLNSPQRAQIDELNLPNLFETESAKAVQDLGITQPLEIIVEISPLVIEEIGIGAWAESEKHKISFWFNPKNLNTLEGLTKWQKQQVAHEINHLARGEFYGKATLLNALIFEGLAVNYEESWGDKPMETYWGRALKPDKLQAEWQKAQKELNLPLSDDNYKAWFIEENPDHPRWTGYALGTAIVASYLGLHPGVSMKELVKKPSREILDQSRFASFSSA